MTDREFDIYIGELRGRMMRFAITIIHHREDAEDIVSQVSERLWRERERLIEGSSAVAYAMTSVRNSCYDHSRYRQRHKQEELSERYESRDVSQEHRDRVELVRWAMSRLPDRQREILHLKDIEGYSTKEIAQIYQAEEPNIRMILSRGRCALRDIIIKSRQR